MISWLPCQCKQCKGRQECEYRIQGRHCASIRREREWGDHAAGGHWISAWRWLGTQRVACAPAQGSPSVCEGIRNQESATGAFGVPRSGGHGGSPVVTGMDVLCTLDLVPRALQRGARRWPLGRGVNDGRVNRRHPRTVESSNHEDNQPEYGQKQKKLADLQLLDKYSGGRSGGSEVRSNRRDS
ncbi:hypothetical protein AB1N83_013255 [Pleurotus pulmonarius]